jgi:hypothetical protein
MKTVLVVTVDGGEELHVLPPSVTRVGPVRWCAPGGEARGDQCRLHYVDGTWENVHGAPADVADALAEAWTADGPGALQPRKLKTYDE